MKASRLTLFSAIVATAFAGISSPAFAEKLIAYPTVDEAVFTISVPDAWEFAQAEEADGFFMVASPSGTELWFAASPIESVDDLEASIEAAVESGEEWLTEHYENLEFGDATEGERDGMPFVSMPARGVEKEGETAVVFTIAFIMTESGALVEFWSIVPVGDEAGQAAAQAIVNSFEPK